MKQEKIGQVDTQRSGSWINFRPDKELSLRIEEIAARTGSTRSAVVRALLREAVKGDHEALDVQLETMRLASHTVKVAASRVLKEITARLPEVLREVSKELTG